MSDFRYPRYGWVRAVRAWAKADAELLDFRIVPPCPPSNNMAGGVSAATAQDHIPSSTIL